LISILDIGHLVRISIIKKELESLI